MRKMCSASFSPNPFGSRSHSLYRSQSFPHYSLQVGCKYVCFFRSSLCQRDFYICVFPVSSSCPLIPSPALWFSFFLQPQEMYFVGIVGVSFCISEKEGWVSCCSSSLLTPQAARKAELSSGHLHQEAAALAIRLHYMPLVVWACQKEFRIVLS